MLSSFQLSVKVSHGDLGSYFLFDASNDPDYFWHEMRAEI
jgi:hypothetical protein